ncbi:MAG: homoserine dehydrogenase [Sedimentisphaerales bacterium]|nr:homoserine dehydrogenase [Sedimentisphaerales bacterium]
MLNNPIRIGLVGFGTVGSGVARLLLEQTDAIYQRTGMRLELACVVDKDTNTKRPVQLPPGLLTSDLGRILNDPTIQIGIELVGGLAFAKQVHEQLLSAGKHVITANKALLAEYGRELFTFAKKQQKCIAFEGSCAGGIPIISALRTGLPANRITSLYGILNGTCNYILTNMTQKGLDFPTALSQAQQKGYAEADPTLDINGTDSAHKLAILASLAFGYQFTTKDISIEGIDNIQIEDITNAQEMGYVLKLLAIGQADQQGAISLRVHPSLIHEDTPLARVGGPFNTLSVFGHAVGNTMFFGRGAGMMPTASAVVADIIEIALGNSQRLFDSMPMLRNNQHPTIQNIDDITSRYYIRLMAKDVPGVTAKYAQVLGMHNISISGAIQHEGIGPNNTVPVIVTTHPTQQKNINAALDELSKLDVIGSRPICIRIVEIPEDKD